MNPDSIGWSCPSRQLFLSWLLLAHPCSLLFLGTAVAAVDAASDAAVFYVSTRGDDRWSGTTPYPGNENGPFASVERARDAVRKLLRMEQVPRPLRVVLRGGTYYLDAPLEFGPDDSGTEQAPVTYAAAPGERVILSGGRRLEGGHWGEANGRRAWVVDIPDVKAGAWRFRQLFVNGERRPRTRLPKEGEYRIESLPGYTGDFLRSPTRHFVFAPGHIDPAWRNLQDVEVVGLTRWLDNRLPIESVEAETRTVTFDRPSLFALVSSAPWGDTTSTPSVYWVENVFETLDTPGQWYLDQIEGRLYYLPRPGEDMTAAEIIAPRLLRVVQVVGKPGAPAHDLRFEGITFSHTEWLPPPHYASSLQGGVEVPGALFFDYAERCVITGGGIEHIGNCGIEINVGCADLEISDNRIIDIGAGGIRVGHFFSWETDGSGQLTERGQQRKAAMPKGPHSQRIIVADNVIAQCGRFTPEAAGVFIGDNADIQVIHNYIHDLFWCAIQVGSVQDFGPSEARNNVIEYNHIHDVGQGVLSDLAGIYTCSTPASRIRYNRVHGVARRDYGGWGIYPDQGSHDLLIEKNLVYDCQDGALFVHHNQNITARNNILALSRQAQVERYGVGGFELTFSRNLVYYVAGLAIGSSGIDNSGTNVCHFNDNLYWNASGPPVLFGNQSLAEWQSRGQDTRSLVADPLFVDPAQGDFRLRSGSPAQKIGFEPWDLSNVGPRSGLKGMSKRTPSSSGDRLPAVSQLPVHSDLPDPLVMFDGRKVTTREMWTKERRPELIRLFQHYMYGKLPPKPAHLSWRIERVGPTAFGGKATLSEVTLSFGPTGTPPIHLLLVVPNRRAAPAPVVLALNYFGNHTLVDDPHVRLPDNWMPQWGGEGARSAHVVGNRATDAGRGSWMKFWPIEDLLDRGYALATFYNGDVDPDAPDQRQFRKRLPAPDPADDCGTIGAWAWGLQRAVDCLVNTPDIDARRIVATGHSRTGKAALLAAAFDERIALAIPHQAGCGGSAPSRARIAIGQPYNTLDTPQTKPPETVANINDQFPHWFNARFAEFNSQPERLPFDQHCLVALCAPRPVLFTNGRADTWINPAGQFEVLRAAAPVYRLLGAGDFAAEELPPDGQMIGDTLGYYLRPSGHSLLREDWKVFLDFADQHLGKSSAIPNSNQSDHDGSD